MSLTLPLVSSCSLSDECSQIRLLDFPTCENTVLLFVSGGSLNITDQVFSNVTRVNSSPSVLEYKAKTVQLLPCSVRAGFQLRRFHHPAAFAGTVQSFDLLTDATAFEILGRDDSINSQTYSVAQVLYPFSKGQLHVDEKVGYDNKFCGQLNSPCNSFDFVFARQVEGQALILLLSDSRVMKECATNHNSTILTGKQGDVLPKLTFSPSSRLTVKSGMAFGGGHFAVDFTEWTTDSGFVVQGSLMLDAIHFNMRGRTNSGAVNVAGGFAWLTNVTTSPVDAKSHNQLLNVSRGNVIVNKETLGGSTEKKMRTNGAILVISRRSLKATGSGCVAWGDSSTLPRRIQRLNRANTCSLCADLSQLVLGGHSADAERVVLGRDEEEQTHFSSFLT
ncbi:hypothetical protein BLNAU_9542 [Blattamonas nauphoetae]|uniref:Uncharacterized protein n=1 Tax=Blattamonas nauphoetae TaxID=2049346 RepID=A0ABQ9XVJ4_9EUKA|nr:hypothetical protein BLNAU_9542 [Blattamonas nauphoetae]